LKVDDDDDDDDDEPERRSPIVRPRPRWEDNIRMDLMEILQD